MHVWPVPQASQMPTLRLHKLRFEQMRLNFRVHELEERIAQRGGQIAKPEASSHPPQPLRLQTLQSEQVQLQSRVHALEQRVAQHRAEAQLRPGPLCQLQVSRPPQPLRVPRFQSEQLRLQTRVQTLERCLAQLESKSRVADPAQPRAPRAPPRALLFNHVGKTGGTSIREWLRGRLVSAGLTRESRRIGLHGSTRFTFYDYTASICFFRPFAATVGLEWSRAQTTYCQDWASRTPHWTSVSAAVEFHTPIGQELLQKVLLRLPELRSLYAAHNGSLTTLLVLREPQAHIRSVYGMWTPRVPWPCGKDKCDGEPLVSSVHRWQVPPTRIVPFDSWVRLAAGLQCCSLTTSHGLGWVDRNPLRRVGLQDEDASRRNLNAGGEWLPCARYDCAGCGLPLCDGSATHFHLSAH